jgi:rhodanese-related sulfurtransferase
MRLPLTHRSIMMLAVILLGACITACGTSISRETLLKQMLEGTAPLIVDVRSQGEYDTDHIPGSVYIPFYTIGSGLEQKGFSKDAPVALYCEHGPRAGIAGLSLFLSGYERVFSLEGHMKEWRNNEYPVEIKTH